MLIGLEEAHVFYVSIFYVSIFGGVEHFRG